MRSTLPAHVAANQERGLRRLLGTLDPDVFLRDYIGEQMLHAVGPRDRWRDLFDWRDLSAILNSGFLPYPSVRLVKDGGLIDAGAYTFTLGDRQWPDSERCQRLMTDGATLVVQNIEHANPRLDTFVRSLERDLSANVRVDVVATCTPVPGLKIHWDNAECFNLQLDGEKDWQVVRPERPYPLTATMRYPERQDVTTSSAPDAQPTWSGTVGPGDLIYLPRGWWHTVVPRTTPSLHLSVAVDIPTLSDFLRWFAHHVAKHEEARRILPVWRVVDESENQGVTVLENAIRWLTRDVLREYIEHTRVSLTSHPDFALPALTTPAGPILSPDTRVRLRAKTPLQWSVEDEWLRFEWRGRRYRFSAQLLPALQLLETFDPIAIEELEQRASRILVRAFVLSLLACGLLSITPTCHPAT